MKRLYTYFSEYAEEKLTLVEGKYARGTNESYSLICEDGTPFAVISINFPEFSLPQNVFVSKEYSENENIMNEFTRFSFVKDTGIRYKGNRVLKLDLDKVNQEVVSSYNQKP